MKHYMPLLFLIIVYIVLFFYGLYNREVTNAIEQECAKVGGQVFHGGSSSLCIIDGKIHAVIER